METKYVKAIQAGSSVGIVILCFVAAVNSSDIQCLTCFAWAAILVLLLGVGALSVKMTMVTTLQDVLVVSVVAGIAAAIINAAGLIFVNLIISILFESLGDLVTSVICWTPLAFILGIILPPIGGVAWHYASSRGLVK